MSIDSENEGEVEEIEYDFSKISDDKFIPPSKRADAPLSGIINAELEDIDPRRYFPDFKHNGILRFSRVFAANSRPTLHNQIWWPSKTFRKDSGAPPKRAESDEKTNGEADEKVVIARKEFCLDIAETPKVDECAPDDADLYFSNEDLSFLSPVKLFNKLQNSDEEEDATAWRFGPAQLWYDRMGVSSNPKKFDYGFRIKKFSRKKNKANAGNDRIPSEKGSNSNLADPFLPIHLTNWEDNVIIDSEDIRNKIIRDFSNGKLPRCGWIPTAQTRTYQSFINAWNQRTFQKMFCQPSTFQRPVESTSKVAIDTSHAVFPMDNFDLEVSKWEDDIIWDSENMPAAPGKELHHLLEPKILTLEYEDDPKMFDLQDENTVNDEVGESNRSMFRKDHQFTKKSELILLQVQQRQRQEEEEQMESTIAQIADKDSFNLSNDDYYRPKSTTKIVNLSNGFGNLIHHSLPAQNINRTFFPTYLTAQAPQKLRQLHRCFISKQNFRDCLNRWAPVKSLSKHIQAMNEERERLNLSEGGGDVFMMREVHDLTGMDSNLVLIEYSEEHPSLLSQPGMASRIRNYYKRKSAGDVEPELEFGEIAYTHTSPFLGNLAPGQCVQTVENNMYRAPIYRHTPKPTDFLLIRTKNGIFIRKIPALFLAGQQCPFYEVPPPNSKQATAFSRDFLLAFIYRLFWESEDTPRRLRMEDIRNAFPHTAESSVRKRLKQCSDFTRMGSGPEQTYWVLKEDFRLPSKEEVLNMVTPEMCCAQWSMLSSEQRLRDAGFGDKYFFAPENEDSSDDEVTMEDEIKCAPWNTTKAYIAAMKGKCLLDQTGIADPTGCGQGFSYVRVSNKPHKEDVPQAPKRVVTGTNADLRKLPLKEAKEICREYGLRDEEMNALGRWDIIHVIRTLSTQAAKARSDFNGMARFARGNIRMLFADAQEKYKQHCQTIFDKQNQVLSNVEEMSTDEYSTGEDSDSDANRQGRNVARMKKKTIGGLPFSSSATLSAEEKKKLEFENEERERLDLQRLIRGEVTKTGGSTVSKGAKEAVARSHEDFFKDDNKDGFSIADPNTTSEHDALLQDSVMKKLRIYRTFRGPDGKDSTRVEVISHPQLIEAYVRIRTSKSEDFIKVFAQNDGQFKEERRKEKRRLQDQLRRLRRNEARAEQQQNTPNTAPKRKKPEREKRPPPPPKPSLLKMRCSACGGTGHMKTNKYCPLYGKRKKAMGTAQKTVGEICQSSSRNDDEMSSGVVAVEGTLLKISKKWYNEAEKSKDSLRLHIPRHVLENESGKKSDFSSSTEPSTSKSKKSISSDGGTMDFERSTFDFDTTKAPIIGATDAAAADQPPPTPSGSSGGGGSGMMMRRRGTVEEADYLVGPHKSVQRRRADPRVSMASVLHEIFTELKMVDNAQHLMFPVNAKKVPDYYKIITNPMDLQQIRQNISSNHYELRKQFLGDLTQILANSHTYNGPDHIITKAAKEILDLATKRVAENERKLIDLEKAINPLLDDNDMVGFSHILKEIVQECRNLPRSAAFHSKVDYKKFTSYLEKVKRPMDLGTIEQNIKEHRYTSIASFREDINQILVNSRIYNGEISPYTEKAAEIVQVADQLIEARSGNLRELEANIQSAIGGGDIGGDEEMDISQDMMDDDNDESHVMEEQQLEDGDEEVDAEEEEEDEDVWMNEEDLYQSQMHTSGQLNADLALSDSDDSDEELISAKRPNSYELDSSF